MPFRTLFSPDHHKFFEVDVRDADGIFNRGSVVDQVGDNLSVDFRIPGVSPQLVPVSATFFAHRHITCCRRESKDSQVFVFLRPGRNKPYGWYSGKVIYPQPTTWINYGDNCHDFFIVDVRISSTYSREVVTVPEKVCQLTIHGNHIDSSRERTRVKNGYERLEIKIAEKHFSVVEDSMFPSYWDYCTGSKSVQIVPRHSIVILRSLDDCSGVPDPDFLDFRCEQSDLLTPVSGCSRLRIDDSDAYCAAYFKILGRIAAYFKFRWSRDVPLSRDIDYLEDDENSWLGVRGGRKRIWPRGMAPIDPNVDWPMGEELEGGPTVMDLPNDVLVAVLKRLDVLVQAKLSLSKLQKEVGNSLSGGEPQLHLHGCPDNWKRQRPAEVLAARSVQADSYGYSAYQGKGGCEPPCTCHRLCMLMASLTVLRKAIIPCCVGEIHDSHAWLAHLLHHRLKPETKFLIFLPDPRTVSPDQRDRSRSNFPVVMLIHYLTHLTIKLDALLLVSFRLTFGNLTWCTPPPYLLLPAVASKVILKDCWVTFIQTTREFIAEGKFKDLLLTIHPKIAEFLFKKRKKHLHYEYLLDVLDASCEDVPRSSRLNLKGKIVAFAGTGLNKPCLEVLKEILYSTDPYYPQPVTSLAELDTSGLRVITILMLEKLVKFCVQDGDESDEE